MPVEKYKERTIFETNDEFYNFYMERAKRNELENNFHGALVDYRGAKGFAQSLLKMMPSWFNAYADWKIKFTTAEEKINEMLQKIEVSAALIFDIKKPLGKMSGFFNFESCLTSAKQFAMSS